MNNNPSPFTKDTPPKWMIIPWGMAVVGSSLSFTWEEITNESNIRTVVRIAKASGVKVEASADIGNSVVFHVLDIKRNQGQAPDYLINRIGEIIAKDKAVTMPELIRGYGIRESATMIKAAVAEAEKRELVTTEKHQHKGGGRPTLLIKAV